MGNEVKSFITVNFLGILLVIVIFLMGLVLDLAFADKVLK